MDRIFVVQKEWEQDKGFPDPGVITRLLAYRCPFYLDKWTTMDITEEPSETIGDMKAIPIGTIQFIQRWLDALDGKDKAMTPLEIPSVLHKFAKREYFSCLGKDIPQECLNGEQWFIKDAGKLKKWNSLLYDDRDLGYFIEPEEKYIVSKRHRFSSEFRTFVYDDEIQACENYVGDCLVFPDKITLTEMVKTFSSVPHPKAYTLDVGILEETGEIVPMEVHPFVACGLYGFNDRVLLNMYESGWDWYMKDFDERVL